MPSSSSRHTAHAGKHEDDDDEMKGMERILLYLPTELRETKRAIKRL